MDRKNLKPEKKYFSECGALIFWEPRLADQFELSRIRTYSVVDPVGRGAVLIPENMQEGSEYVLTP